MTRLRIILPPIFENKSLPKVIEKEDFEFTDSQLKEYNRMGYNIYYFPNGNSKPINHSLSAKDVDKWEWVFVDMDLKDGIYKTKLQFLDTLHNFPVAPTKVIDSQHGIHSYWKISDLTRDKYMEIQKALIAKFNTDKSIWTITQLMRLEGYWNTKSEPWGMAKPVRDKELNTGNVYTCEQILEHLDPISDKDRKDINAHVNKYIHGIELKIEQLTTEPLPERFLEMMKRRPQLEEFFYNPKDRSVADIKIANILQMGGFTEEESRNILLQTSKGRERGISYVEPIVRKVFDNPLNKLSKEYMELDPIANKYKLLEEMKLENYEYKLKEENKKVKAAKELDKNQGIFSFKNTKDIRKKIYREDNKKNDEGMKDILPCITDTLTKVVPLFGVNVLLIGAVSGSGKSSNCANLCLPIMQEGRRILYISTEERAVEVMTRIAALRRGWNYQNRRNWTDNMRQARDEEIDKIVEEDKLVIIDSYTPDNSGHVYLDTTTMEGFDTALKTMEKENEKFDLLIVDYITKISTSAKSANETSEWLMLDSVMRKIEEFSKRNKIPSVVFTQLKAKQMENTAFSNLLPGAKRLLNYATCAIEIDTDFEKKTSTWICHKNRDEGTMFRKTLRFEKGKYIDYPQPTDTVEESPEE